MNAFGYGNTYYGGDHPPGPIDTSFCVFVGGIDRTGVFQDGSLNLDLSIAGRGVARFNLIDKDNNFWISEGESVYIQINGETYFGGSVFAQDVVFPSVDPDCTAKFISITAVDFCELADRKILNYLYTSQSAGDTIKEIVTSKLSTYNVTTTEVEDGPTLEDIRFQLSTVASAFDKIAAMTGYIWWIDAGKNLHFEAPGHRAARWDIGAGSRPYSRITRSTDLKKYRNVQFIRGGKDIGASRTREFKGDGETTTWDVDSPIATEPTVKVNAVAKTVGIRGVDDESDSGGYDWFWSKGETAISQNTTASPLNDSGDYLTVTYNPLFRLYSGDTDTDQVAARKLVDGGDGRYEKVLFDAEIEDAGLASDYAEALLDKHARVNMQLSVRTYQLGLKPGMVQSIQLPDEGIADTFLITDVSITNPGGEHYQVAYKAVDNEETYAGWRDYYKILNESGRQWAIEGEEVSQDAQELAENIYVADALSGTEYFSLDDWEDDPYTCFQAGDVYIGTIYEDYSLGTTVVTGPRFGEPENIDAIFMATAIVSALSCSAS